MLVGAISIMALGFVWFHPAVLGKPWMEGAGLNEDDIKGGDPKTMVGGLIMAAVIAYASSSYASHTEPGMSQFIHGMFHGFMPAITLVAPVLISKGLFEQKSLKWILIGAAYWVLAISICSGIVYALTPIAEAAS